MTQMIKLPTTPLQVADILRMHLDDYRRSYTLFPDQKKIVSHLTQCRTEKLGGRVERCDKCGAVRILYHSCRNRHCPTCQQIPREQWCLDRKRENLPVPYYHVIFTLPHELNPIVLSNKSVMFNLLFTSVSKTLLQFGQNTFGGKLGFIAVLHTWDQKLSAHFHLHCLIAGGAFNAKENRWVACSRKFLFSQKALSVVFRGKFVALMTKEVRSGKIGFCGDYRSFKDGLYNHKWVVSVRDPINNPEHVLEYLARYTHRVAIANSRLESVKDGMVTFRYKDRKNNTKKRLKINAVEFIRRFFLHILPDRFHRIRHYGFLANRYRNENLSSIRKLMELNEMPEKENLSVEQMILKLTGVDITVCPCCEQGKMSLVCELPKTVGRHIDNRIRLPNGQTTNVG
jgi:hypothetical protein